MFGERIDYWILRPLVHARGRASEEALDAAFAEERPFDGARAQARLAKLKERFEGRLTPVPGVRYLDVGCGRGDLDIALVRDGATDVTGIDFVPRNIEAARVAARDALPEGRRPRFVCGDIHAFEPEAPFDVVLSHEALEHISAPDRFIQRLGALTAPGGSIFLAFGPLFHSPFGDHMGDFFRVPVPWRGALFSEGAILKLRAEFFRPGNPVRRFEDISIGMNKMRFSEFKGYVDAAGLRVDFMGVNPQLKALGPLAGPAKRLSQLPLLEDYLTMSVYAVLTRPEAA